MSACFHSLSNDSIGARIFGGFRFTDRCRRCKPLNATCLHSLHEMSGVKPHDRRYDRRPYLEHCFTLRSEVWQWRITSLASNLGPPIAEKMTDYILGSGITSGSRIGNPKIELKPPIAACAKIGRPSLDRDRLH